ncbi:MAG: MSHA biogenesis protein MshP [Porticoccus sp.]|jgi:MSHA biogenesis protein MshP
MKRIHSAARGFATISAIFLLVVMVAMGAFMLTFSNTQQLSQAQDIKGSQAYWAARAGLEWGMGDVIRQPSATAGCAAPSTSLPGGAALFEGGFTVVVTCTMLSYTEGPNVRKIISLTAVANTATTPGSVGFIERRLSVSIEK